MTDGLVPLLGVGLPLAYRPFLDPLHIESYWILLLLPLVLCISIVYKAIKIDQLERLPREALRLSAQIVAFMVLAAAALWLLTAMV